MRYDIFLSILEVIITLFTDLTVAYILALGSSLTVFELIAKVLLCIVYFALTVFLKNYVGTTAQ